MKTLIILFLALCISGFAMAEEIKPVYDLDNAIFVYKGNSLSFLQLYDTLKYDEYGDLKTQLDIDEIKKMLGIE